MTDSNNNDRLDRIERTLDRLVERDESIAKRDEITAIRLERLSLEQESAQQRITSIERSVQAMLEQRASDRLKREEEKAQHEENMGIMRDAIQRLIRLEEAQNRMLVGLDEDRPIILRKLNVIENKVDRILDRTSE